jgi:hypothetical protein
MQELQVDWVHEKYGEGADRLKQSGGGPGRDGCNYTTGYKCPCHHLNGGPCLFNVVTDVSESKNLAADPAHKSTFDALLARFWEVSATGVPMAGLSDNPPLERRDEQLQCNVTTSGNCFFPYGPDIAWPHPSDPPR